MCRKGHGQETKNRIHWDDLSQHYKRQRPLLEAHGKRGYMLSKIAGATVLHSSTISPIVNAK